MIGEDGLEWDRRLMLVLSVRQILYGVSMLPMLLRRFDIVPTCGRWDLGGFRMAVLNDVCAAFSISMTKGSVEVWVNDPFSLMLFLLWLCMLCFGRMLATKWPVEARHCAPAESRNQRCRSSNRRI